MSGLIALLVAIVVFRLWFPEPYSGLLGGQKLFCLIVGIDVVCGPFLTAFLFNPKKTRNELTLDLSLIVVLQFGALVYGTYSIALARPVALVFESDRFVAVTAAQIDTESQAQVPKEMRHLSWTGPITWGTRSPRDSEEKLQSIEAALQGVPPSARPGWWEPYEKTRPRVQQRMKPLSEIRLLQDVSAKASLEIAVHKTGLPIEQLFYLPLVSQRDLDGWIVLLDAKGHIVGHAPFGGFDE